MVNKSKFIKILLLSCVILSIKGFNGDDSTDDKNIEKHTSRNAKASDNRNGIVVLVGNNIKSNIIKIDIKAMEINKRKDIDSYKKEKKIRQELNKNNKKTIEIRKRSTDTEIIIEKIQVTGTTNELKDQEINEKYSNRTVEYNMTNLNSIAIKNINSTAEICVGAEEYCNLTREEYFEMLNNYIYPQRFEWVLIATYVLVFIGGLVGNALVCMAVYRNPQMRTVTNYFIVNLAVADFMVILFCLPPTLLWDVTETWFFGAVMCKIVLYFQSVSVTVSVLTLTFISGDRWYAICFPLKFKSTTKRAKLAILVIWAVALTLNAPELVVLTTEQTVPLRFELQYLVQCVANWSQQSDLIWHVIKVVFVYTVPLVLMTVAHYNIVKVLWRSEKIPGHADTAKLAPAEKTQLRSRRKAAKMLAAVVIMFAVCYFPVHLLSMIRYSLELDQTDAITYFALISHVLCYANSAINPLIYNFMSGKFRRAFRRAFACSVISVAENSTSLSRLTTVRKPVELVGLDSRRSRHGYTCKTTLF